MVAEQTTHSRYWPTAGLPAREIHLAARLETPGEAGVDVATELLLEPPLPPPWDGELHRQIYDGVHAGLAAVARALPSGGLRVVVTDLRIVPALEPDATSAEVGAVGRTVRALTASTVEALWVGLGEPTTPPDRAE